jgi:hypothetical protein
VYLLAGGSAASIGHATRRGTTTTWFSAANGGQVPALANGWTQVSGNDAFGVTLQGHGVALQGAIKPGTSNSAASLPPGLRPATPRRFVNQGWNASNVYAPVPLTIGNDGAVLVNEAAGGTANCANLLSLASIWYPIDS